MVLGSMGLATPESILLTGVFAGGSAIGGELAAMAGEAHEGVFVGVPGMKGEVNGGLASAGELCWEA